MASRNGRIGRAGWTTTQTLLVFFAVLLMIVGIVIQVKTCGLNSFPLPGIRGSWVYVFNDGQENFNMHGQGNGKKLSWVEKKNGEIIDVNDPSWPDWQNKYVETRKKYYERYKVVIRI